MEELPLIALLFVPLAGALAAAASGLPAVNRRLTVTGAAWLLALAPLAAFGLILWGAAGMGSGDALVWRFDWIPSLGLSAGFYFDHLGALFGLLVTGIGALVVIYSGYYFRSEERPWGEWRFLAYLLLFMASMLGLVLACSLPTRPRTRRRSEGRSSRCSLRAGAASPCWWGCSC
jgi:NADH:ubiquinone oxidoreductase subunit 5 (subunit L)/multisubunit Na+/H+ antiporter MnhA subunit